MDEIDKARRQIDRAINALKTPFRKAQDAGDEAEMARLKAIARRLAALRRQVNNGALDIILAELADLEKRIREHTVDAGEIGGTVTGGVSETLAGIDEKIREIMALTGEEPPGPEPVPGPSPSPGGDTGGAPAGPVTVEPAETPAVVADATVTVADPGPADGGQLLLTEAHLIALWKRSLFPIDGRGRIVFGIRGARPVDFGGTALAERHEIVPMSVNYRTMNCTLGHWLPGTGLALFPGSTVPFHTIVARRVAANGVGVNQMGLGRYTRYTAGWHKRSEGSGGHWALRQECPITLQRTGDDADYDLLDRWQAGRIAGDNIHCAFGMGPDDAIPDHRFSSAGCQVVAGTVRKGRPGSEAGPWKRFIAPFHDDLGNQQTVEYVLFSAAEVTQMIRHRYAGKTVVLRIGSRGALVARLQERLNAVAGTGLRVDGDFGVSTFLAVTDFQTDTTGPASDDGIVGPATAQRLGMTLPGFSFDDAIGGGPGHDGPDGLVVATGTATGTGAGTGAGPNADSAAPPVADPGDRIAWGAVTNARHGPAFKAKVIGIAGRLKCDPNHLMAVMAFESAESFAPDKKNPVSGATGLIQFMPATARGLGTTIPKLAAMTAIEQLDFVEKHFRSVVGSRPLPSLSDLYMAVLWPKAVGKLDSHVLFRKGSKAYQQNAPLDVNKNGRITKAEAASKVQRKLVKGMKDSRLG